jgi:hypothetical protein
MPTDSQPGAISQTRCRLIPIPTSSSRGAADPGWGHFELYDLIRVIGTGLAENGEVKNSYRVSNTVGGA